MNWTEWFLAQLQSSAEGFVQGFWSVPERLRRETPVDEKYMGRWPAARHVWHVTEYERCVALPSMRDWQIGEQPGAADWLDDDVAWAKNRDVSDKELIDRFWVVRRQEIALVEALKNVDWNACRDTGWGRRPLAWVVMKTHQHTWEHGDTLMRMGLWWEHILEQIALAQARQPGD